MAHQESPPQANFSRVVVKALLLFITFNLAFAFINPLPQIAKISAYNWLLPGRQRLPYGDRPDVAYNLSLYSLEAMIASHAIAGAEKSNSEFRVVLIGDSSTWGFLLKPDQTLSAFLNSAGLHTADGRQVQAFNLGYPTMSLTKDLLFLEIATRFQPDLIVWLVTLESYPDSKQLESPIVQNNPDAVIRFIKAYSLDLHPDDPRFVRPDFWGQTIIGQRRPLADIFRLQLYGILWSATGIDQYYQDEYQPPQEDLEADLTFHDLTPPTLAEADLAFETLQAGIALAGEIPILIVNEPIYISQGENSDIRYNFFYPKWAYDQYRVMMEQMAQTNHWNYIDEWDLVDPAEFTNSAIHFSPSGEALLAEKVGQAILEIANP